MVIRNGFIWRFYDKKPKKNVADIIQLCYY